MHTSIILRAVSTLAGGRFHAKPALVLIQQENSELAWQWPWLSAVVGFSLSALTALAFYVDSANGIAASLTVSSEATLLGPWLLFALFQLLCFAGLHGHQTWTLAEIKKSTVPTGLASSWDASLGWAACAAYAFLIGASAGLVCLPFVVQARFMRHDAAIG